MPAAGGGAGVPIASGLIGEAEEADARKWVESFIRAKMMPDSIKTVNQGMQVWFAAKVLGLEPMVAVHQCYIVGNRPSFWGNAILGAIQRRDDYDPSAFAIDIEGSPEDEDLKVTCTMGRTRNGKTGTLSASFSWKQAKRANLLGHTGWKNYPEDTCTWKAIHRVEKLLFADVTMGVAMIEEQREILETEAVEVKAHAMSLPRKRESQPSASEREDMDRLATVAEGVADNLQGSIDRIDRVLDATEPPTNADEAIEAEPIEASKDDQPEAERQEVADKDPQNDTTPEGEGDRIGAAYTQNIDEARAVGFEPESFYEFCTSVGGNQKKIEAEFERRVDSDEK